MTDQIPLLDEDYDLSKSQWYTRPELAERVVRWALKGVSRQLSILEPSAGCGALIRPIPRGHGVTAYEIDPRRETVLLELLDPRRGRLIIADYLRRFDGGRFDLGITNPPYEDGSAERFVKKACFQCDRVVALLKTSVLHGVDRWSDLWSTVSISRLAILSRRPGFDGPSEGSPTSDYIVVECSLRDHLGSQGQSEPVEMEWW
jgi:predicted RNA methylase